MCSIAKGLFYSSFQVRAQDHKKACARRRYSAYSSLMRIKSQATKQDVLLSIKQQNHCDKTIAWNSTRLKCVIKHNPHQQENVSWKSDCLFPTWHVSQICCKEKTKWHSKKHWTRWIAGRANQPTIPPLAPTNLLKANLYIHQIND